MLKKLLYNFKELDDWLSDNYYFEDGHVLSVNENPLEIVIGYNVDANYKANSERNIIAFKLKPSNVTEWTFDKATVNVGDSNYIIGIEAIEKEKGVCLEFDTPIKFKLCSNSIDIEELDIIKTTFKPNVDESELHLISDLNQIPKPEYWKEKLQSYGHNIIFRFYAGDEKPIEQVPYPDYQGYYIQLASRLNSNWEGIFLEHMKVLDENLYLSFKNKDKSLNTVWKDLTKVLATLPNVKIYSGNCEFSGAEWIQYLNEKRLPEFK